MDKDGASLAFYKDSFFQPLENYQFGQTQFSSSPIDAIKALKDHQDATPIVVLYHQSVIGFLILEKLPQQSIYGAYNDALLFRTFSLDINYRGKGLSKIVMNALIPFVKENFTDKTHIVLTVNDANKTAINLYKSMGYSDTMRTFMGKKGKQLVFEKYIS
ncbi:MAG: GNAT family N-acetyltransferase [Sporolactobacillus sp.]